MNAVKPLTVSILPILKWAGGKRQLLPQLEPLLPSDGVSHYCEPFVGGGALFFYLRPPVAVLNDANEELIRVYKVIRSDVDGLIDELTTYPNTEEFFYYIRGLDRDKRGYDNLSDIKKAARTIYLNKTCFNGLYRVNRDGNFNTPYGNYKRPNIVNSEGLRAVSSYLNLAKVKIKKGDFSSVLKYLSESFFVYLDPPYDPPSPTNFTAYTKGGFDRNEQIRLFKFCKELDARNIKFMLSNSPTDFIADLYQSFDIKVIKARRAINSDGSKRGEVQELVIRNYK